MSRPQSPLPAESSINLLLHHVGSMDARLIGLSVERHWKKSVQLVSELPNAQVALLDCDRPGVEDALAQLASFPRIGVVCYAFQPKDHAPRMANCLVLGKPLNLETLPNILLKTAEEASRAIALPSSRHTISTAPLSQPGPDAPQESLGQRMGTEDEHDLCGNGEDIALQAGGSIPERIYFPPSQYLIGHLHQAVDMAVQSGRPHVVSGLPRLIGVQPKPAPTCVTAFRDNQLRPISMTQLPESIARIVPAAIFTETTGVETIFNAEDLLWNLATWASRGRLPEGTNPHAGVRLRAWPNFSRIFVTPHALRIVAFWTANIASPVEVARRLAIPQRYVFSIYSSARFSGLLDASIAPVVQTDVATAEGTPNKESSPQKPSILSRILRKLLHAI